ncbi:MAG: NUDIX hydrolase [Candidatus Levyibacteriota bacterium]
MKTIGQLHEYLATLPHPPQNYNVAVGALIFTKDDKVILLERGKKARDAVGMLEGVGGGVDANEHDLHAVLRREVREEIGVEIDIAAMLTVKVMPGANYPFWVAVDYLCRLKSGTPTIKEPEKIKAIHMLSLNKIQDEQLSEYQKIAMVAYRKKFGNIPFYK